MSLHMSLVSIEGSHLSHIPEILSRFQYRVEPGTVTVTKEQAIEELNASRTTRVGYEEAGWTHIGDGEMILFDAVELWKEFSAKLHTRVVTWIAEGTSGTYAFSLFDRGQVVRSVLSTNGKISINTGKPLPEEEDLDWTSAFEDDVLGLVEKFGASYEFFQSDLDYHVYRLSWNGE